MENSLDQQRGIGKKLILGFQHLFAMFGATVLVPLLTGLNPAVAICCAGIGTLILDVYKRQQWECPMIMRTRFWKDRTWCV